MIINSIRNGANYLKPDGEPSLEDEQQETCEESNLLPGKDRVSLSGKGRLLQQAAQELDGLPGDHVVVSAEVIQISSNHKERISALLESAIKKVDMAAIGTLKISIDQQNSSDELKVEIAGDIEENGAEQMLQVIQSEKFATHFRGASNADHLLYARQSLKTHAIDSHQSVVYANARYHNMMNVDWNFSVMADRHGISYVSPLSSLTNGTTS